MSLEDYLQELVKRELSSEPSEAVPAEESGMVWENGLFVYRTGRPLPDHVVDDGINHSREERSLHILGDRSRSSSSTARSSCRASTPIMSITDPAQRYFLKLIRKTSARSARWARCTQP